jgi:hypothetical protein
VRVISSSNEGSSSLWLFLLLIVLLGPIVVVELALGSLGGSVGLIVGISDDDISCFESLLHESGCLRPCRWSHL